MSRGRKGSAFLDMFSVYQEHVSSGIPHLRRVSYVIGGIPHRSAKISPRTIWTGIGEYVYEARPSAIGTFLLHCPWMIEGDVVI